MEYYPGDNYVDIIAFDDYQSIISFKDREKLVFRLNCVVEIAESKNKVAAFSETGLETIPDKNWFANVFLEGIKSNDKSMEIAYVMLWRNARLTHHYAPYLGRPSAANFKKFRNDPFTLFEFDLLNMYKKP